MSRDARRDRIPQGLGRRLALLLAVVALAGCGPGESAAPPPETAASQVEPEAPALAPGSIPIARPDPNPARPGRGIEGRFRKLPAASAEPAELDAEQRAMIEQLESIGYATGSREAPRERGITVYDPKRAQPGLNFYTSGHAPEAVLMDMQGRVVHRWQRAFADSFPGRARPGDTNNVRFWRRAKVLPNGDLIALHSGLGIVKLDRNSKLLWARPHPVHHDLEVRPNGEIVVLTRKAHMVPRVSSDLPILEDFVAVLHPDGRLKREMSLLEAFETAGPEHSWVAASARFWEREKTRRKASARRGTSFDIFHTNSVQLLGGASNGVPAFRKGNLLISACHLDTIAVVDMDAGKVTWSLGDRFQLQHDPRALPDGNVMVFDNHWMPERSRVAIVDPKTGDLVWEYVGAPERPFYSRTCGTSRRLENGNILITESDGGRAFEVTRDKQIVWEFYNPHRAGESDQYIATLFELVRLPPDFGADWLTSPASAP